MPMTTVNLSGLLFIITFVVIFSSSDEKSIIRSILEKRLQRKLTQRSNIRPGIPCKQTTFTTDVPVQDCPVTDICPKLALKLVHVCLDCEDAFGTLNLNMRCRENCFNNTVFHSCAIAMMRPHLNDQLKQTMEMDPANATMSGLDLDDGDDETDHDQLGTSDTNGTISEEME